LLCFLNDTLRNVIIILLLPYCFPCYSYSFLTETIHINYLTVPRRDSISRPIIMQADTLPLGHAFLCFFLGNNVMIFERSLQKRNWRNPLKSKPFVHKNNRNIDFKEKRRKYPPIFFLIQTRTLIARRSSATTTFTTTTTTTMRTNPWRQRRSVSRLYAFLCILLISLFKNVAKGIS
jgi:hypothetical protein